MSERSREELERALASSERKAAELQAWVDSSEAEAEQLRAQITELEARPAPAATSHTASAELQQWLDASEAEVEKLRAQVSELEARPAPVSSSPSAANELQQWLDASEAEVEKLRAKVSELEARPAAAATSNRASGELQQWLDASEAEVEKLRAQVSELEARPAPTATSNKASEELQQWLDASEAEVEKLRAQVSELEARPAPVSSSPSAANELQQWLDASEAEVEKLRAQVSELEARPAPVSSSPSAANELQQWLDASEAEVEKLRAQVSSLEVDLHAARESNEKQSQALEENQALRGQVREEEQHAKKEERQAAELRQWLDAAEAENEKLTARLGELEPEHRDLKDRVGELETATASLREMNKRFGDQAEAGARRDLERLRSELETARASGATEKVSELASTLSNAREAIATLEAERSAALEQVHRYANRDSDVASDLERKSKAELASVSTEKDARIAVLQANLTRRDDELKTVEARLHAYVASEVELKEDRERWRVRDCEAREQLAHVRDEHEQLQARFAALEHQFTIASTKLQETKEWLANAEAENEGLEKSLEATRIDHALHLTDLTSAKEKIVALGKLQGAENRPPEADEPEGVEGFSVARLRRLEALLATEQQRADALQGLVRLADTTVAKMRDELEGSHGRLCDLLKKLGLSGDEFDETLASLQGTRRELQALKAELEGSLATPLPPPPPLDAFDELPPVQDDVVSGPLDAMGALAEAQAQATQQATDALKGEQKAREQTLSDLTWLKAEVEKLGHVRDDLRTRLGAMVQREVKRRGVVTTLLERLRAGEVATASRLGAVRRLQAAIELAQRNAVKVQTIYFQKQIGSLQRQLEIALGKKKAPVELRAAPKPALVPKAALPHR